MRRLGRILIGATLLAGVLVVGQAQPAGAGVLATYSSGSVTVTVTGDATVGFTCPGGVFKVNGLTTTPSVLCSAVSLVQVSGDGGAQSVSGHDLDTGFSGNPSIQANLGDGIDVISETRRSDVINLGPGNDRVELRAGGAANSLVSLGADLNTVTVFGTDASDTMTATSTNGTLSVATTNASGTSTSAATGGYSLYLRGGKGNDTLSVAGVTQTSGLSLQYLFGDDGNDSFQGGPKGANFYGGTGTNTFNGAAPIEQFHSSSDTDVIHTGSGSDLVFDIDSLRSGGRSIDGGGPDSHVTISPGGDTIMRVRAASSGSSTVISSLNRSGIAALPATVTATYLDFEGSSDTPNRGLADVVIPGPQYTSITGDAEKDDLVDVTVPTGTWTVTTASGTTTIDPDAPGLGNVDVRSTAAASIHGPWATKNEGFAHRITRDLLLRFPTFAQRTALASQLTTGTTTRAEVAAGLVFNDEYRGLDVDRVFVRFLKRQPDPGGRTYWITGLGNGKTLRKFRAQLFGSNEYFSKAGSTTSGFVKAAYADVLGRLPDAAGLSYWVNKITAGTGRGSVANSFLSSTEARRTIVKDQFLRFANRYPNQAELDTWIPRLSTNPTGEQELIVFLASSGAYHDAT